MESLNKSLLRTFLVGLLLLPFSMQGQFVGGAGDGHDAEPLIFTLSLYDPAQLFAGGAGDGYDAEPLAFTLSRYDPADLFAGGAGDGHDAEPLAFTLSLYDPADLFAGGAGDGHDAKLLIFTLNLYDPAQLFAGGAGDGHDMAFLDLGNSLPLTLLTFEALAREKYVLLRWTTTDEVDTDFFTVEKNRGTTSFTDVGTLAAAGFATPGEELTYELRDDAPWDGTSYYRLRTTDLDATFSLSELRRVVYTGNEDWDYLVFPNPNDGQQLGIRLTGTPPAGTLRARIFDASGRQVLEHTLQTARKDTYDLPLPGAGLGAGTYLLSLEKKGEVPLSKIIVVTPRRH